MAKRERIEDFFADGNDYEDAMEEALSGATIGRDIDFIVQLRKGWTSYGMRGYMSESQYARLANLAGLPD